MSYIKEVPFDVETAVDDHFFFAIADNYNGSIEVVKRHGFSGHSRQACDDFLRKIISGPPLRNIVFVENHEIGYYECDNCIVVIVLENFGREFDHKLGNAAKSMYGAYNQHPTILENTLAMDLRTHIFQIENNDSHENMQSTSFIGVNGGTLVRQFKNNVKAILKGASGSLPEELTEHPLVERSKQKIQRGWTAFVIAIFPIRTMCVLFVLCMCGLMLAAGAIAFLSVRKK